MQYCSVQHRTLLLSPVTSTAGYSFWFGSIPSFFLELFLHWSPVAYWAPTDLGSFSFSILSFCLFILFNIGYFLPLADNGQAHRSPLLPWLAWSKGMGWGSYNLRRWEEAMSSGSCLPPGSPGCCPIHLVLLALWAFVAGLGGCDLWWISAWSESGVSSSWPALISVSLLLEGPLKSCWLFACFWGAEGLEVSTSLHLSVWLYCLDGSRLGPCACLGTCHMQDCLIQSL